MKKIVVGFVLVFLAIQFVPVDRTNPDSAGEIKGPADLVEVLKRSCFDCHSFRTRWPWYGYIAPLSWLIAQDVKTARGYLNFSLWETFPPDEKADWKRLIPKVVSEGKMPLPRYLLLHPAAALTPDEKGLLKTWGSPGGGPPAAKGEGEGHSHDHHRHQD